MLHLLPLRFIGRLALAVTVLGVLALIVIDSPEAGSDLATAMTIVRWALGAEAIAAFLFYHLWPYIPGLTARWLFPHIDGSWDGHLHFKRKQQSAGGRSKVVLDGFKDASLYVHQSLTKVRLILETDESTSETLVVHAERDPDFSRFKLFYIFENRSRDGRPNTARSYRGTAIMEIPPGRPATLNGTYFTDQGSEGTFKFERRLPENTGWRSLVFGLVGQKGAANPVASEPREERALDLDGEDQPT